LQEHVLVGWRRTFIAKDESSLLLCFSAQQQIRAFDEDANVLFLFSASLEVV